MGYNCAVVALAGVGFEDLARVGITTTGRTTTGDEALSEDVPHAAVRDGQLVFACADPRLVESAEAVAGELGARMAGVVFGSTADFYLLHLRDGDRVRQVLVHEGETVESTGDPWPEEAALEEEQFTEDGMLAVLRRAADVDLDIAWMNQEFHELRWEFAGGETSYDDPGDAAEMVEEAPIDSADSRYVPISPVTTSFKVTGVALAVGLAFEVLFAVLVLTTDASFGPLVVHVLFALLAALTLFVGRLALGPLLATAGEAAILLVAVVVTMAREGDQAPVLTVFAAYLAALIGVLAWHGSRVVALKRALQG